MSDGDYLLICHILIKSLFDSLGLPDKQRAEVWATATKGYFKVCKENPEAPNKMQPTLEQLREELAKCKEQS